jgi:hypothetical protein
MATRVAKEMAEILRGWVQIMLHFSPLPFFIASSNKNIGSWVDFPQPDSPHTTTTYHNMMHVHQTLPLFKKRFFHTKHIYIFFLC